ncbi:MAG TPA: murein biosynthesis integral membrane protein MurJ, partial [Anaerolineae bacterium]
IARQFGIGADLDAYYAAFRLPDLLFTLVAGGALATAFIPVFADFVAAGDRTGAWRLASAITNLVLLVVAAFALLVEVLAPELVHAFIAPGFTAAQQAETVSIMRIVLLSTLLFAVSAVQASVLNGFKHFFLPALAPVMYPLGIAAGALWLAPHWGVRGLAFGAVAGAALHLAVKVPGLIRYGFHWWPVLDLKHAAVRRVLALVGPRVLDLGIFQLVMLLTTNLASRLGPGRVSALEWGWGAMQLPETVIGTAFGMVALPTLAELAASGNIAGLRSTLGETLREVVALTVPAACALMLLGGPLLQILYQRGAFDARATAVVLVALRFYAIGLVGQASLELVARGFFARQDTVTPLLAKAGSGAANLLLALLLMGPLSHGGLALANSLAVTGEVLALLLILRRRLGGIEGRQLLSVFGRVTVASLLMSAAMAGVLRLAQSAQRGALAQCVLAAAVGLAVYLAAAAALRVRELHRLPLALLVRS